jgi:tyrosyl-tRNA synthetase
MDIFTSRVTEVIGGEEIKEMLEHRPLNVYWGTSPTGLPHFAYFTPLLKLRDIIKAGHKVTILIADLHAILDKGSDHINVVEQRVIEYKDCLRKMLSFLGVQPNEYSFVLGSSFQKSPEYVMELFRFCTLTDTKETQNASSEVVKQQKNPQMSHLIYSMMQSLDEVFLGVDVQVGGNDQRKLFAFSRDMAKSWVEISVLIF